MSLLVLRGYSLVIAKKILQFPLLIVLILFGSILTIIDYLFFNHSNQTYISILKYSICEIIVCFKDWIFDWSITISKDK